MNNGWIKLYRKSLENIIFTNEKGWKIWTWCLLKSCHKKEEFFIGRQKIDLTSGQFVTGRDKMASELSMSGSTAWWWLLELEKQGYLNIKKTTKYSIITILKWREHQDVDNKSYNRKTTDEQQIDTYKNDKNVKNDKKEEISIAKSDDFANRINPLIELFKEVNPNYTELYKITTQRNALLWLLKKHGPEKIEQVIRALPKIIYNKYSPVITTPLQLKNKLAQLVAFVRQKSNTKSQVAPAFNEIIETDRG